MKKKITCLCLAFLLLVSSLCSLSACTGGGESSSKPKESESTGGGNEKEWYSDLDYRGAKLTVSQSTNVWDTSASIPNAEKYTRGPEDIGSDDVLNMCYTRNREVATALNVNVQYVETNYDYSGINPYLDQLAMMSSSQADLIINDIFAVPSAILKGQLYNLKSQAEENYLDFDKDGWYKNYIEGYTYDPNYAFIAAGDYFMDVVRSAHVLYVNTELFQVQLSDFYADMKEFYQAILDGEWTYDVMQNLVAYGWKSTSNNSYATPDDEIVGFWILNGSCVSALASSASFSMLEKTQNGFILKEDIANPLALSEVLCGVYNGDGVYCQNSKYENGVARDQFTGNGALFLSGFWLGDLEYPSFFAMENKAPIVYPRWNETFSRYCSYVHDSAEIGYIMTNVKNFSMVSAYVELLNEKSVDIMHQYFEFALKFKQNTDPEALSMLDLIRDNIRIEPYALAGSIAGVDYWNAMTANTPSSATNKYSSNRPNNEVKLNTNITTFYQMNGEN